MTVLNLSSTKVSDLALPEPEIGQWIIICDASCVDLALRNAVKLQKQGTPFVVYETMPVPDGEDALDGLVEIERCD